MRVFLIFAVVVVFLACKNESVTIEQVKSNPLKAYVLTNAANQPESGVRVGLLDFKHETPQSLKRYGIDENEIKKFTPYFGLTGQQALEALNKNPLTLTKSEFDQINSKVYNFWNNKLMELPSSISDSRQVH